MEIEEVKLQDLRPYERNPRKNEAAVPVVMESIRNFGFKVPLVIDKDNVIVCGHTRYKAAKRMGMDTVLCIRADDLTPEQVKAFRLVDNRAAEMSEWDIDPTGKHAVVIGRGDVGRPVARYLLDMDATVTICHSRTPRSDLYAALKTADIVVGAAGLKSPLYPDLHSDAVVIDYGIRPGPGGKLHGDIADAEGSYCKYKTGVPGGMGLMVRAGLLLNIVDAMERWANAKK